MNELELKYLIALQPKIWEAMGEWLTTKGEK